MHKACDGELLQGSFGFHARCDLALKPENAKGQIKQRINKVKVSFHS
jgi:hypothetical protein